MEQAEEQAGLRGPGNPLAIDLALQGGGSHGAFTWGVIERLIGEPWLDIEGVSGTSAGAMNAVVLAYGHAVGGPAGAAKALEGFWRKVSEAARFSPIQRTPLDVLAGNWSLDGSPAYLFYDISARLFSPYDLNPAGVIRCATSSSVGRLQAPQRVPDQSLHHRHQRPHRAAAVFRNAELTPTSCSPRPACR